MGLYGLTGAYRLTVSAKSVGGDHLALALEGSGSGDVEAEIVKRFKSQTLISADDISFEDSLDDGPAVVDERT